ncbi:MAG: DUF3048 domain-containing protein [Actinomycetota bacterium]
MVLLLASCSDDSGPAPNGPVASAPSPALPPTCPLTGEEPAQGVDLARHAVAVKIENSPSARPQHGLEAADIVYEEVVEGGITRFMAIYHCSATRQAGPVRSARFDDPKIALPATRIIAYSGANSIVEGELNKRNMIALEEDDSDAFYRVPPGVLQTHNLFIDVGRLRRAIEAKVRPPRPLFRYGPLQDGSKKARRVSINFTAANTIEYRWRNDAWERYEAGVPFMLASGAQVAVPNLLIQEVEVNPSSTIVDSAGNPSPDIRLMGTGRALLFRDGRVIRGTWRIKKEGRAPVFTARDGEEFVFAPGQTWVELVPSSKGAVKGSFSLSKKRR